MVKDWKAFREEALKAVEDGYILVLGDICPELEEITIECLLTAKSKGKKEMTILINSYGGKNSSSNAIKATMAISGMRFIGIVLGYAKSNGFNILQLCDKRLAMNSSLIMFHWGSCTLDNDEISAIVSGEKWPLDRIFMSQHREVEEISRRTKVPKQILIAYASQEREFSGLEALDMGFIDEVIDTLPRPLKLPELEK